MQNTIVNAKVDEKTAKEFKEKTKTFGMSFVLRELIKKFNRGEVKITAVIGG